MVFKQSQFRCHYEVVLLGTNCAKYSLFTRKLIWKDTPLTVELKRYARAQSTHASGE